MGRWVRERLVVETTTLDQHGLSALAYATAKEKPVPHQNASPRLLGATARAALAAMLPAYFLPLLTALPGAWITRDPQLWAAAATTIPVPGALAAGLVALVLAATGPRWQDRFRGRRARFVALVGLLTGVGSAGLLALLVGCGAMQATSLRFALPGPFIAGAATAFAWARARLRHSPAPPPPPQAGPPAGPLAASAALLLALAATGCVAPLPSLVTPRPVALLALSTGGAATATFGDVARACIAWGVEADRRTAAARRAQGRWAAVSTIAGLLGTGAGVATAVASGIEGSRGDDEAAARTGQLGGTVALGFGLVAGVAGGIVGARSNRAAQLQTSAVGFEHAVSTRSSRVLAAPLGQRERVARVEAPPLLRECLQHASRADLPVRAPSDAGPSVARAVELWRSRRGQAPALELADALGLAGAVP
jgi:hypothetical protein